MTQEILDTLGPTGFYDKRGEDAVLLIHGTRQGQRLAFSADGKSLAALGEAGRLDAALLANARRLFARVLEAPGGLRDYQAAFWLRQIKHSCSCCTGLSHGLRLLWPFRRGQGVQNQAPCRLREGQAAA